MFKKLGIRRVAALRANNRYGRIHIDEIRDGCRRLGHPFVAELNYVIGDTDFTQQLRRIEGLKPEAVVTWGDGIESALIVKQMRELGMTQPLFGSDRMVSDEFLEMAGRAAEGVVAGYPWDPTRQDPKLESFRKTFHERFGQPPETYASHAYDGMNILIEAIEHAGLNRARIRDYVADLGKYAGVTGEVIFDAAWQDVGEVTLARVEKGKWTYHTREQLGLPPKGL